MAICILSGVVIVLVLSLLVLVFHLRVERLATCVEDGLAVGIGDLKAAATRMVRSAQIDMRNAESQALVELKKEIDAAQERASELEAELGNRIRNLEARAGL